jgi:hypothetical protein
LSPRTFRGRGSRSVAPPPPPRRVSPLSTSSSRCSTRRTLNELGSILRVINTVVRGIFLSFFAFRFQKPQTTKPQPHTSTKATPSTSTIDHGTSRMATGLRIESYEGPGVLYFIIILKESAWINLIDPLLHKAKNMSTAATAIKRRRTISPYFESPFSSKSTVTQTSSNHFLCSPSSACGSLGNLGLLIYTWSELPPPLCTRRSSKATAFCEACEFVIQNALRHFEGCPTFKKEFHLRLKLEICRASTTNDLPCVHVASSLIEKCVRHLCVQKCFLRAFAPSRDWVALRKTIHELTDEPLGEWAIQSFVRNERQIHQFVSLTMQYSFVAIFVVAVLSSKMACYGAGNASCVSLLEI